MKPQLCSRLVNFSPSRPTTAAFYRLYLSHVQGYPAPIQNGVGDRLALELHLRYKQKLLEPQAKLGGSFAPNQ